VIGELPARAHIVGTALIPGGRLERAVVHVAGGRISELEIDPPRPVLRSLRRTRERILTLTDDQVLAPAFIDVHCHGAGGGDALSGGDALGRMAETLWRHGVGAVVAAIATAPIPVLLSAARRLTEPGSHELRLGLVPRRAAILGLHLEGPALCPERSGGHDPSAFGTPADVASSMTADPTAWAAVRVVTIAPELDGGLEVVARLAAAAIVVSIGHTDASADIASAAYAAGARSTTHLFNGMPPLRARDSGPVGAALADAPFIELITDGVHVEARLLAPLARSIGEERLLLVSDALPLAASRRRTVSTPGSTATVRHGLAVHPDGTLAGSLLLLDGMVERAVRSGIPLATALRAATENPARLLGLADRGRLEPGGVARLVVVTRAGHLQRVLGPQADPVASRA
jgi:N-acetylglucosamine-6-phosphate deacetylase